MHLHRWLVAAVLVSACGISADVDPEDGIDDSIVVDGKSDGGFSAAEIAGALRAANELALAALDDDAGLSSRAATNIVTQRAGVDGIDATTDDAPFTTLAALDAVPYVGPVALGRLVDHARSLGWITAPTLQRLLPADTAEGENYGYSMALSGSLLAVAAPQAKGTGAVYVFERSAGGGWTLAATLASSDPDEEWFGYDLELDGSTLVTSTRAWNMDGTDFVRRVHVFVRSGSTWSKQASFDNLADVRATALSGDTLAVSLADDTAVGGTHVDIYHRSGSTWSKLATLHDTLDSASNTRLQFARSIALDGPTLVVGSITGFAVPRTANDRRPIAVVDVYTRVGSTWSTTPVRLAPDATTPEYSGDFGARLALSGSTLVVGTPRSDGATGLMHAGSATIYVRATNGTWQRQAVVHPETPLRGAHFGEAVDVSGDQLLVGASSDGETRVTFPYTDSAGAAYLFERTASAWTQRDRLTATTPKTYANFANDVQLEGTTFAISAWREGAYRPTSTGNEYSVTGAVYAN